MKDIKTILGTFDNSHQAEVKISYCSVDNEYTATLALSGVDIASASDVDIRASIKKLDNTKLSNGIEFNL